MKTLVDLDELKHTIIDNIKNLVGDSYSENYTNNILVDYEVENIINSVIDSLRES